MKIRDRPEVKIRDRPEVNNTTIFTLFWGPQKRTGSSFTFWARKFEFQTCAKTPIFKALPEKADGSLLGGGKATLQNGSKKGTKIR